MVLAELTDDVIICNILTQLTHGEVEKVAAVSKRFLALSRDTNHVWRKLMENEFDVRVTGNVNSRTLFRKLYAKSEGTSEGEGIVELNFRGYLTTGGVQDLNQERYWVNNLFSSNLWETYSSHHSIAANINCVAVAVDNRSHQQRELLSAQRRASAIRCFQHSPFGLSAEFKNNLPLIPSESLFSLFIELYENYGTSIFLYQLGDKDDNEEWEDRVHRLANELNQDRTARSSEEDVKEKREREQLAELVSHNDDPVKLYDSRVLPCATGTVSSVFAPDFAVAIRHVTLNRHGHCSCPVQTGMVFSADITVNYQTQAALDKWCDWGSLLTADAVAHEVSTGRLPPIVQTSEQPNGTYIEFAPPSHARAQRWAAGGCPMQPIVWFRMISQSEAHESSAFQQSKVDADTLHMELAHWHGGAFVNVKLLSSENRMEEFSWDDHPSANIDCAYVGIKGVTLHIQ